MEGTGPSIQNKPKQSQLDLIDRNKLNEPKWIEIDQILFIDAKSKIIYRFVINIYFHLLTCE